MLVEVGYSWCCGEQIKVVDVLDGGSFGWWVEFRGGGCVLEVEG